MLVCHQYVCKNYVDSVYVGGYGGPEWCPVSFLVVGEGPSVLLKYVAMLYNNCGNNG